MVHSLDSFCNLSKSIFFAKIKLNQTVLSCPFLIFYKISNLFQGSSSRNDKSKKISKLWTYCELYQLNTAFELNFKRSDTNEQELSLPEIYFELLLTHHSLYNLHALGHHFDSIEMLSIVVLHFGLGWIGSR